MRYKRIDKFLTHAVWLIEVEEHDGFATEHLVAYNVFATKGGADRWLHKEVFKASKVKPL